MAVITVLEDFQQRGSNEVWNGSKRVATYQRRFVVQTNDPNDGPKIVKTHPSIPRVFDKYVSGNDNEPFCYCNGVSEKPRKESPMIWDVVATYTSDTPPPNPPPNPSGGGGANVDPTLRGTKYGCSTATFTRPVFFDQDTPTTAILNSAGQPFNPPIEAEYFISVVTAQFIETVFPANEIQQVGYVNKQQFTINGRTVNTGTGRLSAVRQAPTFENGVQYWDTTLEWHIKADGWKYAPLDQGTVEKLLSGGVNSTYYYKAVTDKFGVPLNRQVNLDGHGKKLDPNAAAVFLNGQNGVAGPFAIYPSAIFNNY